jgi:type 1 glutamine amidotransferase
LRELNARALGRWTACASLALSACGADVSTGGSGGSGGGGMFEGGSTGGDAIRDGAGEAHPIDEGAGDTRTIDESAPDAAFDAAFTVDATDAKIASDAASDATDATAGRPARVLLYHFSTLEIPSVPAQLAFFKNQLTEWHFESDDSMDPSVFTDAGLAKYAAVAMINTCFEPFGAGKPDRPWSEALQRFVQKGGGLFGTHCAAVTFASANPPALYNQLFGGRGGNGYFDGRSDCRKTSDHVTTAALPATFVFNGNLDNADFVAADSVVLVRCTWATGHEGAVSWYRTEGLGRVFYTNFGKVDTDLRDATLGTSHIVPGLAWVLGR